MKTAQLTRINEQEKMSTRELVFSLMLVPMFLLFLLVGIDKLWDYEKFRDGLLNSPLVPDLIAPAVAISIPLTLLGIAVSLVLGFWFPVWMKRGLWGYLGMMTLFTLCILMIITVFRHEEPCLCLGIYERWGLSWRDQFWLDVVITVFTLITMGLYYLEEVYKWLYHMTIRFEKYLLQRMERKPDAL